MLKRVAASTLLEVIISMVIIMAVFTVAIGIYTKVTQSAFSFSRAGAQQQMKKILQESIENKDFEDAVVQVDSIEYTKTVTAYAGYSDLLYVKIEASQNGQRLAELKQIIKKQEDEN